MDHGEEIPPSRSGIKIQPTPVVRRNQIYPVYITFQLILPFSSTHRLFIIIMIPYPVSHFNVYSRTTLICEAIKYILLITVPIVTCIYLIPNFIDPEIVNHLQINFRIHLLSKPFCEMHPGECLQLMDPNFGDPRYLKRKVFKYYEIMYIRHYIVEIWDTIVLSIARLYPFRKMALATRNVIYSDFGNDEEFFEQFDEALEIVLAIFNSIVFQGAKGVLISRMWIFFIVAGVFTVVESWSSLGKPLRTILRSANTVY